MSHHPQQISMEEARSTGIDVNFELMENGEKRYRITSSDGSSYCRTVAPENGAWQNSHYHKVVTEFYVVQSGWLAYAEITLNGDVDLRLLREGESVIVPPFVHHNIYLASNSVLHTIKYGGGSPMVDWFPSDELDHYTKKLLENELIELAKKKDM